MINSTTQTLTFKDKTYPISTAKNGLGEENNSFKTPRGKHKICAKFGENMPKFTLFQARKNAGIWNKSPTEEDLILSRILWLDGIEKRNKNSKQRCIYIHGTSDEKNIGKPVSQGCIRMKNDDIIQLFNCANINDGVIIM